MSLANSPAESELRGPLMLRHRDVPRRWNKFFLETIMSITKILVAIMILDEFVIIGLIAMGLL